MLQFSGALSNSTVRLTSLRTTWSRITQQLLNSTLSNTDPVVQNPENESLEKTNGKVKSTNIVEIAMKNINSSFPVANNGKPNAIFDTVDFIFADIEKSSYDPYKTIEAFTILGNMMKNKRIDTARVIYDTRFVTLLNNLSQYRNKCAKASDSQEINEQFSKLSEKLNIHIDTYIMILKAMGTKKSRNLPALKGTVDAIVNSNQKLNLKKAADILYSLSAINFPHEGLIKKVCQNIIEVLRNNKKLGVVKSIITSLGMLQFKDTKLLDELSVWIVENWKYLRSDDIVALMMTLAILDYIPKNGEDLFQNYILSLKKEDMVHYEQWLNLVWALTILNRVTLEHISSVLDKNFVNILSDLQFANKQKLWNLNAAAKLIYQDSYKGPLLNEKEERFKMDLTNPAEKINYIKSVLDPLKSVLPTTTVINSSIPTDMGFLIDIESIMDEKCSRAFLPQNTKSSEKPIKVAFIIQNYHSFTRGVRELTGISSFQCKLLQLKGYKVIEIPFTDYNVDSKLITRLKYLRDKLSNELVK